MLNYTKSKFGMKSRNNKDIFNYIYIKCPEFTNKNTKINKMNESDFYIPKINEYNNIIKLNYNLNMIKQICEHYQISKSGTKQELMKKLYLFLYATHSIKKIQHLFRNYLKHKVILLKGPGFTNKNICVNDTDFLTMENLIDVPDTKFYSFKDDDNVIYGFDMSSLLSAINKDSQFKNPYNRKTLPISKIKNDIHNILRLNIVLNLDNEKEIEHKDDITNLSIHKQIQLKFLSICQKIDELGNYTDVNWFTSLSGVQIIKFFHELKDIWSYRAQLSIETKMEIYPYGDPFHDISSMSQYYIITIDDLKIKMIKIIENFIHKGINTHAQFLGASYILSALTLVNENAAQSMPWLYYSVAHVY